MIGGTPLSAEASGAVAHTHTPATSQPSAFLENRPVIRIIY